MLGKFAYFTFIFTFFVLLFFASCNQVFLFKTNNFQTDRGESITPGQSGPLSNVNEGVVYIFSIFITTPSFQKSFSVKSR